MNNRFFKYMASFFVVCILAMTVVSIDAMASDVYDIEVVMLKQHKDTVSMGNAGLVNQAKLYVDGDNMWLNITMQPITLNGTKGYLGNFTVDGRAVSVVETYDVEDKYNAPDSSDDNVRGKAYPKVLSFPVSLDEEILNCGVYVPVMGELGSGNQRARLQIKYPENLKELIESTKNNNKDESSPKAEEKDLEASDLAPNLDLSKTDGLSFYSVPVALWHFYEEKESMGNGAMSPLANIVEKDGKMTIFIESKKMEVTGITASLINLYYDDGKDFVRATPHAFDLEVEGELTKRPSVFSVPLNNKNELINVLVDPKVEVMGDEPIKARLKIDFANMKQVDEASASVFLRAMNGSKEPDFDASKDMLSINKGMELEAPAGAFTERYSFYANEIKGDRLKEIKADFDSLDMVYAYEFKALGDLSKVANDLEAPINDERERFQPSKEVQISLPLKKDGDFKLYSMGDKALEVAYKKDGEKISFSTNKLGDFALVYKPATNAKEASVSVDKVGEEQANTGNTSEVENINAPPTNKSGAVIVTGTKEEEKPALIIFFIALITGLLIGGIYFAKKYYKEVVRELAYGEELKHELMKKEVRKAVKEESSKDDRRLKI